MKPGCDEVVIYIEGVAGEEESSFSIEIDEKKYEALKGWVRGMIVCATNHPLCVKRMDELIEEYIWRDRKVVDAKGKIILSVFISREFNISYDNLGRMFREEHEMSVQEFYTERQTRVAEKLLDENLLSLLQISVTLNFCNVQSFCEYFLKHNGSPPKIYRNRDKN